MTTENFTKAYDYVMSIKGVSLPAKMIYCRILRFTENKQECYASNEYFVEAFDISLSTVKRATKELEQFGWITKVRRFNTSNIWLAHKVTVQNEQGMAQNEPPVAQNELSGQVKMSSYETIDYTNSLYNLNKEEDEMLEDVKVENNTVKTKEEVVNNVVPLSTVSSLPTVSKSAVVGGDWYDVEANRTTNHSVSSFMNELGWGEEAPF